MVKRVVPYTTWSINFYDTERWSLLWAIRASTQEDGPHKTEVAFLSNDRYFMSNHGLAMYERDRVIWTTDLPRPTWEPIAERYYDLEWEPRTNGQPAVDESCVFIPTTWSRPLEPGGGYDGWQWQDEDTIEVISVQDGRWVRRIEQSGSAGPELPDRRLVITRETPLAEVWNGRAMLGTLEAPLGRSVLSADVVRDRALLVLDGYELLDLKAARVLVES
jgi:hypothetical protein